MVRIDARGLACPQPVLLTKKELANSSEFEVLVDNNTARNNIERFAKNNGAKFSCTEEAGDYLIVISK